MSSSQVPVESRLMVNRQASMKLPPSCTVSTTSTHVLGGVAKEELLEPQSFSPTCSVSSLIPDAQKVNCFIFSPTLSGTGSHLVGYDDNCDLTIFDTSCRRQQQSETAVSDDFITSCDNVIADESGLSRPDTCSSTSSSCVSSYTPSTKQDDTIRQPCSTPDLWDAMSSLVDECDHDQQSGDDCSRFDTPNDVGVVSWDSMERLMQTHEYGAWMSR